MKELILNIEGMTCSHCANAVEDALRKVNLKGKVNLKDGSVTIEADLNELSLNEARKAIKGAGYSLR